MRRQAILSLSLMIMAGTIPMALGDTCICQFANDEVSIKNFPDVQTVAIAKSLAPIEVKETDLTRTYYATLDLGTAERKPVGPFPLDGRKKVEIQIAQLFPKQGTPPPLVLKWYVRFHSDDPFFDPCLMDKEKEGKEPHACSAGFPPVGVKVRPLMPASLADRLEEFFIAPTASGIATLDAIGTEALLVVENTASGPRSVRINIVLDR